MLRRAPWTHNNRCISLLRFYFNTNKTIRRKAMEKFGPPVNRDMRVLDRDFFKKDVLLLAAQINDPKLIGAFTKACRNDILSIIGIKHIVQLDKAKGILLRAEADNIETYKDNLAPQTVEFIEKNDISVVPHTLELNYSFWKTDDILRLVLPENLVDETPTSFTQAGHIAHLNLRSEFKPYGPLIGQVILDKISKVETVVDKVDSIATKFRTFQMNLLAGKNDFVVTQAESGCKFKFDFSTVYWNSRLSSEHNRLVTRFNTGEVVADVFAGVGPFAVPAGRKDVTVLANDLNPESYKYLRENIRWNHVEPFVKPFNLDGREFIRQSPHLLKDWVTEGRVKTQVKRRKKNEPLKVKEPKEYAVPKYITNYVMNLPDSAIEFLDEFVGLYADFAIADFVRSDPAFKLPIINVHCFEKWDAHVPEPTLEELHHRVHARVIKTMKSEIPFESFQFHVVRKVAPTKIMFCATFQLPANIAFSSGQA